MTQDLDVAPDAVPSPVPAEERPVRGRRRPVLLLVVGCVLALVVALVLFVGTGTGSSTGPEVAPGISASAASILDLGPLHGSSRSLASDFTLTDQHGQQVSLDQYRGKAVVLSFNDDKCTDLCTLLAQDVVVANRDLGAAATRVVFLSVNANPFYPQVSAVKAWTDEHGLGTQPNWVFATGSPSRLKAVWARYGAYVHLDRANRTVVHSTELYFVGPDGHEQAIGAFGSNAANTALYAHTMAQMAVDLLPPSERGPVAGPTTLSPSQSDAAVGARAPSFTLPLLGSPGRTLSLADLRGKYVVLNFWASTCTVCVQEMPHIQRAYRDLGSKVAFVGIDVSDDAGAAFAEKVGATYPLVADTSGAVAGSYQISGLPFTAVLGPGGKLLIRHPGGLTTEQLEYILETVDPSAAATASAG